MVIEINKIKPIQFWVKLSLLNLSIVGLLGVIMRIKIGYSFPYFDQKYLQLAHSNFAFLGWVSQTLWVFIVYLLHSSLSHGQKLRYQNLLLINNVLSIFVFLSFLTSGYGIITIFALSASWILSLILIFKLNHDYAFHKEIPGANYIRAGLLFQLLAGFGTLALIYMMASKNLSQHPYLASLYWYLHFSYNGWFLFACIGLWVNYVEAKLKLSKTPSIIFYLFAWSCIPAYGLSVLWLKVPLLPYIIIIIAALMQSVAWVLLVQHIWREKLLNKFKENNLAYWLIMFVTLALSTKFLLQLGSVIPAISKLAFGFRPIVIAYLHLILLAIISVFLVFYAWVNQFMAHSNLAKFAIWTFMVAVLLNELVLGIQGIASLSYTQLPYINDALAVISALLLGSILTLLVIQFLTQQNDKSH
jgi:hypothetical protein